MSTNFENLQQNDYLSDNLKLLCLLSIKWRPFQFLVKFVKNALCLANIFQLRKHHLFAFINVGHMCKMQRSSGKFRLQKHQLYDKRPAKTATSLFQVFLLFRFYLKLLQILIHEKSFPVFLSNKKLNALSFRFFKSTQHKKRNF